MPQHAATSTAPGAPDPRRASRAGAALRAQPDGLESLAAKAVSGGGPGQVAWHGLQGLLPGDQRLSWAAQQLALGRVRDEVVAALGEARIPALVLKGAALGQYLYASPLQRSCSDVDLLLPGDAVEAAGEILRRLGFRAPVSFAGPALLPARVYLRRLGAWEVPVDLHWALLSDPLFRHAFPFQGLWAARRPLPAGGFGLGPVHALLHAALHRGLLPRRSRGRLIWLLDVHLLWGRMTAGQRGRACDLARSVGGAALLADALLAARQGLGSPVAEDLLERLGTAGAGSPAARLLASDGRARRLALRLAALPDLRSRLAYLGELALPPGAYMEARFGSRGPGAYLRRALAGARGLLGREP